MGVGGVQAVDGPMPGGLCAASFNTNILDYIWGLAAFGDA